MCFLAQGRQEVWANLSPIVLPTANKLCLFFSKWTVSIYIFLSFIENSYLEFICTHFPESLRNLRLRLLQAPMSLHCSTQVRGNCLCRQRWTSHFPPTCLEIKRVRLKPLSLETRHLPCLFLASLLGV